MAYIVESIRTDSERLGAAVEHARRSCDAPTAALDVESVASLAVSLFHQVTRLQSAVESATPADAILPAARPVIDEGLEALAAHLPLVLELVHALPPDERPVATSARDLERFLRYVEETALPLARGELSYEPSHLTRDVVRQRRAALPHTRTRPLRDALGG